MMVRSQLTISRFYMQSLYQFHHSLQVPVQDVWVLERSFQKVAYSKWRLAGRISGVALIAPKGHWWRGKQATP
jgi:hypothetical protein